jgi:nicotinate-nucleotide adenylyltransferase
MSMRKQIVVYGGSFNPPTIGHAAVAKACFAYAQSIAADFWILPSGPRPDKQISTDPTLRLVSAMLADIPDGNKIVVETFEMNKPGLTETYVTKKYVTKAYPDHDFTWVYGIDSVLTMNEWEGGSDIWHNDKLLVVNRPGYELDVLPPHATMLSVEATNVSSTMLRERIKNNESYDDLVSDSVYKVLIEHQAKQELVS